MRICKIEGCERKHMARGWCKMHYQRWLDHGDPGPVGPMRAANGGLPPHCKIVGCGRKTKTRGWCQAHYHLVLKFDIDPQHYEDLRVLQNHRCAICGKPETVIRSGQVKSLAVDHNHDTGEVRALLCQACNVGLGQFGDSVDLLERAVAYLREYEPAGSVFQ